MEYESRRNLCDIAPLLERLDQGDTLTAEEQAELDVIQALDGRGWKGKFPHSISTLTVLESLDLKFIQVHDMTPLNGLTALRSLDLRYSQVCDLTPLSGLTALELLYLSDTQVSDLAPLSGLTALKSLNLWDTQVSDLTPLSGLTVLESLDLRNTHVSDLTPLSGLTALESLNLWDTQVSDLTPLSGLPALESLDLRNTHVSDLTPLSGLTVLKSLKLRDTQVSDLTSLSGLTALESLRLIDTQVSDLTPLSGLAALKSLDLSYTQASDLTPLSGLTVLKSLNLSDTQVSDLTPLSGLTALNFLDLSRTQASDLTPLSGLTALNFLGLSNTQISDLTPLAELMRLRHLELVGTRVEDLRPIANLMGLEELALGGTQVRDLTPLSGLTGLKDLYVQKTKVRDLTPLIGMERLEFLHARGCNLRSIPWPLYKHLPRINWGYSPKGINLSDATLSTQPISIFRESDEVIQAYYDAPKRAVRESKVIFLGDGGAGKTHTIKRILNKGKDDGIGTDATLGISINPYPAVGKNGDFSINFWDFGGQENMHAMHRCFLTERTLYVVVINNRWDLDQQARYWLDNVRSFAPDSPVILAVNLWEGIHKFGLDTNRLHRDYPNLVEVQPYAAKGEDHGNFQVLTNLIVEQAEKLDSCAMELPVNWAEIRQELINRANSDEWHLDRETYHEICAKHGLGEDQSEIRSWLLEWFNDLGICFSYHRDRQTREELGTYKVLNPKWLTSAIYILLNTAKKNYRNGVMTLGMIETLLESPNPKKLARKDDCDYILPDVEYSPEECQYILQVMRKFGLSYPIDEDAEFIPALCDSQMPKELHPTGWGKPISYEFRYSFLPDSVIQRLMIRLYGSKTFTKLWRKGFRFDELDHGLVTVVDAGGPNDVLRIDVYSNKENKGRDVMMGLITNIAAVNAELNLKPEQYIIVHGNRGEIPTPADMILQAKEQKLTSLLLYSKENGLVEKNVDEILGCTYGEKIIEAAQQITKGDRRRLSETVPQIINNYYVYGNIYNSNAPDSLLELLERMSEQNIRVSSGFIEYLLEQLWDSGDENAKKLAEDLKEDKSDGFLKKLWTGIKALPKLAAGAKTAITDGKAAYDAAKPVIAAVKAALLTHGPQIAEGTMELLNLLPPG